MANYYGTPAIVTDGLVFAVDAGNGQSYVSGSLDTFSLVSSNTGSFSSTGMYDSGNQKTWYFDGVGDAIEFNDVSFNSSGFSISCWFNSATFSEQNAIIGSVNDVSPVWVGWYYKTYGGANKLFWYDGSGKEFDFGTLSINTWYNLVAVCNSDTLTGYLNNVNTGSLSATYDGVFNYMGGPGGWGGINDFEGKIANVYIYNRALSANEVLHNYNALKGRFT